MFLYATISGKMKRKANIVIVLILACSLVAWFFGSDGLPVLAQDEEKLAEEEKKLEEEKLEEEKDEIDDKLDDELDDLEKAEAKKNRTVQVKLQISNEIGAISSNIVVIEDEIAKTNQDIELIDASILESEKKLQEKRHVLAEVLRSIYQIDIEFGLLFMEKNGDLGQYFAAVDGLDRLELKLYDAMEEIKVEKTEFEKNREEQQKVFELHDDQKKTLEQEKNRKSWTLGKTQQELNSQEATIGQIQSKVNKLRSELSALLDKGYNTNDIKDAAKFASKVTGVRKNFIMGMLVVESDLGRYTGGCDYKESRMSSYRKTIFKEICEELDYNYKKMKVSCPPSGYSGTGGAMGVAQFMSDTWMGYKDSIAAATGHDPPDPWNLTDGVTAMAIKLAKVSGVTSHKKSAECNAAKLYLSGTTSSKYDWYCDKVNYWADNYEKLMD